MSEPAQQGLGAWETVVSGVRLTAPCVEVTFYFEHAPAVIADLAERALQALDPQLTHFTATGMTRPAVRGARSESRWAALFARPRIGAVAWMKLQGSAPGQGCSAAELEVSHRALTPPPTTPEAVAAKVAQNRDLFEAGGAQGTLPLSFVRATFPLGHPLSQPEALLAWVQGLDCVSGAHFVAGQAGFALNADRAQGGEHLRQHMQAALAGALGRHPGLGWEYSGAVTPRLLKYWPDHTEFLPRFKRANWLTFVQGLALDELCGGRAAAQAALQGAEGVVIHDLGPALMLQAGPAPEIGDTARGDDLPAYRAVAKALAPARLPRHGGLGDIFTDQLAQGWLEALERSHD